ACPAAIGAAIAAVAPLTSALSTTPATTSMAAVRATIAPPPTDDDGSRQRRIPPVSMTGSVGGSGRGALGAHAEDVDDVMRIGEPMLGSDLPRPRLHRVGRDLDGRAARAADQMM